MIIDYFINNIGYAILFIFPAIILSLFISMFIDLSKIKFLSYISWWHVTYEGYRYTRGFFLILLPFSYILIFGIYSYFDYKKYSENIYLMTLENEKKYYEISKFQFEKTNSIRSSVNNFTKYRNDIISKKIILKQSYNENPYLIGFSNFILENCTYDACYFILINNMKDINNLYPYFDVLINAYTLRYNAYRREYKKYQNKETYETNTKKEKDNIEELGENIGRIYQKGKENIKEFTKPLKETFGRFMKGFEKGSEQ